MTTIVNPVLRGMYPDPSWIWDAQYERVALVNSTFEYVPGLPIHVSDDLATFHCIGHAVDARMAHDLLLDYVDDSGGLYAPTLRIIHGRYVIACTVARLNEDAARKNGMDESTLSRVRAAQGNFVIVADSLEGPWEGPYWIAGAEGIDPDLFEDVDGAVFWTQTRVAPNARFEGQTEVWTQRIDPVNWVLLNSPAKTPLWRGFGAESVWVEGPHLYRIGDWTYLMTAEGGTSFDHSEMIMRAHTPHGLAMAIRQAQGHVLRQGCGLFHPDPKNPLLTHRMLGNAEPVQCVGHADLLHHPRLGWWLACLGTRQTATNNHDALNFLGRETFVAPVHWEYEPVQWDLESNGVPEPDNSPGWPVLSGGVGRLVQRIEVIDQSPRIAAMGFDDDRIQRLWPKDLQANDDEAIMLRGERSMRYRRMNEESCTIALPANGHVRIRQDNRHCIDFITDGNRIRWTMQAGVTVIDDESTGTDSWEVSFAQGMITIANGNDVIAEIDAAFLSTEWSGGFVGCMIGMAVQ